MVTAGSDAIGHPRDGIFRTGAFRRVAHLDAVERTHVELGEMRRTVPNLRLLAGFCALLLAGSVSPAAAELVVLDNGRFFKVARYDLRDDSAVLELRSGGRLELPLDRIERVVDDEVVPEEEQEDLDIPERQTLPVYYAEGQDAPDGPWSRQIFETAKRHYVNPAVVTAVVRAESAFDPRAVSHKGARGLMQLMPATARRFGVGSEDIFDPARNLDAGVRYLRWLLDRFDGELHLALAAYNAGEGTVERYGGVPPYRETRSYIRRIYRSLGLDGEV